MTVEADVVKFKVEFYNRGVFLSDTGDIPASTVTGAWTTDEFRVAIPANTDAIRVVPVAGIGSAIRIDNHFSCSYSSRCSSSS